VADTFTGPFEQKPIKNFGEKGAWADLVTAQILDVQPIISGMVKATNFQFCTHIHRIDRNKSPLKIAGKVAMDVVRNFPKKFRAPTNRVYRAVIFAIAQLSCCLCVHHLINGDHIVTSVHNIKLCFFSVNLMTD